jgi:hypothetical protein
MEKTVKNFSEYLVAAALAVGALTLVAIDAQAAAGCGPNGCQRYPHRSQWPVGQSGKYYAGVSSQTSAIVVLAPAVTRE